jgi:hypothetical protein
VLGTGQNRPWRVALDDTHVYWINAGANFASDSEIVRASRDGSALSEVIAAGQVFLQDIVLDEDSVYALSHGATGDDGAILRLKKAAPSSLVTVVSGLGQPGHLAIDATHVYWTSGAGVMKLSKIDDTVTTVVPGAPSYGDIAIHGSDLYFTEPAAGRVRRTSVDGGPVQTLAADQVEPFGIAVDGTTLYWTTLGDSSKGVSGAVMKVCR